MAENTLYLLRLLNELFLFCSDVDCATRDNLNSLPGGADAAAALVPPLLTLWPENHNATNGTGLNQTIYIEYGAVAPLSFEPCPSFEANTSCAAVARDDQDGDVTLFINVSMPAESAPNLLSYIILSPTLRLRFLSFVPGYMVVAYV